MKDVLKKTGLVWLWLSVFIIGLDQLSKWLAVHFLTYDKPYEIFAFFNLTLRFNAGAAFGFLGSESGWQIVVLSLVTLAVLLGLLVWLYRIKRSEKITAIALSLILGGAIGNLIDRLLQGYVIDFFDFHIQTWHFATFNVGDSAICVGAFLLILCLLKR